MEQDGGDWKPTVEAGAKFHKFLGLLLPVVSDVEGEAALREPSLVLEIARPVW